MKKLLCLVLCLMMILPAVPSLADGNIGTCGNELTWKFEGNTLTISGSGEMDNYSQSAGITTAPWNSYAKKISNVVIGSGVTSIGEYAFRLL